MTSKRSALLVSAVVALALAGCGGSRKDEIAASYCPTPLKVQDAQRLTRFKAGPGRDPRDVMFEAALVNAGAACKLGRNRMDIDVVMRIAVNAGPSVGGAVTQVPFFVRLIDASGAVVQGSDQLADYKLSAASPRGMSDETMAVTIPFSDRSELGGYRIAVGLRPTPEELEYTRRAAAVR